VNNHIFFLAFFTMTLTSEYTKKQVDALLVPGAWESDPEYAHATEHKLYVRAIREIASGKLFGEAAILVCKQLKRLNKHSLERWFA
jgi:hypothetical protein